MTSSNDARSPETALRRTRTRLAAGLAALGLVSLSIIGGTLLSASAAPTPPAITSPADGDGVLDSGAPTFTVDTSSLDQDVEVWLTPDGGGASLYCSATTGPSSDVANCTGIALSAGGYTAQARGALTSVPGDWSLFSAGVRIVSYNNGFPAITGSPAPTGDSDVTPTLIGTGPAMGTVHVGASPTNPDNGDCDNVAVAGDGTWGCTWGITPTNTVYNVSVSAENYLGANVAGSGGVSFSLREPYLASVTAKSTTTNYKEPISGGKDVNTTHLVIESSPAGLGTWTTYCDLTGIIGPNTWTCPSPTGGLSVGNNDFRTTSYNEAGGLTMDGGPFTQITRTLPGAPTFTSPTATWTTSDGAEGVQGARDGGVARVVVEIESPLGSNTWLSYCTATNLPYNSTGWGCAEPDHGLALGANTLRVTGYTGDNINVGTSTTSITLVAETELTSPTPGGYTNSSVITFSGTSGWEGQFAAVLDNANNVRCNDEIAFGLWDCTLAAQPDGTYTYKLSTSYQTRTFISFPFTITIDTVAPLAPSISGPTTTADRTPTISGLGEPGARMTVYLNGTPVTCVGGTPSPKGDGTWSCELANSLSVDSYAVSARQTDLAGNVSTVSAVTSLLITGPDATPIVTPTPTPTPTPTITAKPFTWKLNGMTTGDVHPGDEVVLSADDLPPGLPVNAEFHSKVTALGSTTVGSNGTFSLAVTVPKDATAGLHHFVVTVWSPTGEAVVVEQAVTVVVPPKATAGVVADHAAALGTLGADRSDPGAPSSFTHSLSGVGFLIANPIVVGVAALAALALFLLVAFPAELLNSTISEQYSRFSRRLPRGQWLRRLTAWLDRTPLLGGIAITLAAAVIFGFADPGFGFDITSFRVVLSCAIALFVVGYVASTISGRILGGRWKLSSALELKPLGLILTVVGVVLSRLLDFSPGFLLGLILGLSLVGKTTAADRAKSTLVQAGVVFGLSIVGWLLYSVLSGSVDANNFGTALLLDTLVALTAEGLTAVFIGMLPFKFLDGPSVFDYSKKLWVAAFVLSAFAFVAIIIPSAWGNLSGSAVVWVSIVVGFSVVAVGIYLYFRFWARPLEESEEEGEPEKELVESA